MLGNGNKFGTLTSVSSTKANGIWSLSEQLNNKSNGNWPSNSPISYVGLASAATSSVTLPSHQVNDLILILAQSFTATIPSLPAGYIAIHDGTANADATWSWRVGYKLATSASETSGTWTNATKVAAGVYRGVYGGIGANAESVVNTTTPTWDALTLQNTDNTSWVVGLLAHERAGVSATGVPYTTRLNQEQTTWWDTNATISSFTSQSATLANGGRGTTTITIELKNT
jgi:hypothetical protein